MEERESIFIVDDDIGSCKTLKLIFNKKGYEAETAATGKEAIEKVKKRFFNIILLDIRLPDVEGIELITHLKEMQPDMEVIMITAYASIETAIRSLNDGAAAFITKPLNMEEVLAIISNVLEKQRLIREKRLAEEKLKESESKLEGIISSLTDQISIIDRDFNIIWINNVGKEIFGPDVIGRKCYKSYHNFDKVCDNCIVTKTFEDSKVRNSEYVKVGKNGKERCFWSTSSVSAKDEKGDPLLIIEISRDITDRKKNKERLEISEKKYREAYDLTEFYKDLFAHDISNILQNIQTSAGLISLWEKDIEKKDEIGNLIEIINDQVLRGAKLVSNIRKLSQLDQLLETLNSIEVIQTIKKAMEFIYQSYVFKEIDIQLDTEINECFVLANEFLLDIFENILFNAVKHNENPKIEILIRISKQAIEGISFLRFEFIDNGIGIPNELKEKIFKGVIQKQRKVKGMGLGLLLTTKILNSFKGKIYIEDKVKGDYTKGSKFIILLPGVG